MKRTLLMSLFVVLAAGLLSYAGPHSHKKDESVASLWLQYEKASEKDQIQKMADILEDIKDRSLKERSTWDYYRACCAYVDVMSARNWKLRGELASAAIEEISAYGEPLLDYLLKRHHMTDQERLAFLDENAGTLQARRNPEVYESVGMMYHKVLLPTVTNDYEFVLWDMLGGSMYRDNEHLKMIYERLSESLDGVYPQAGLAEFAFMKISLAADVLEDHEEKFGAFAQKYDGTALGVMADEYIIARELAQEKVEGSSEHYKELRKRVGDLIRERDSFRDASEESLAGYCTVLDGILKHLDAEVAYVEVKDGNVQLMLRNLDKVKVRLQHKKETVFETVLRNTEGSYYTLDTLALDLPELDDGDYLIQCFSGTEKLGERSFPKYTLSSAVRQDAGGLALYVADYMTGEPVDSVDILLYKDDRKLAEVKGLALNGFTRLPSEIADKIDERRYVHTLVCMRKGKNGKVRKSVFRNICREPSDTGKTKELNSARIMLDRYAYNPGEKVRFKAVVYSSSSDGLTATVPAGQEFIARLVDMNDEILSSITLVSNEFGSVAGEFPLDAVKTNGRHEVRIYQDEKELYGSSFIVDEYVLPTFDVTFDTPEKVFFAGDDIAVGGRLKSYTGHPLSSAKVDVKVMLLSETVLEQTVAVAHDGAFRVTFKDQAVKTDDSWREYSVEVKVTDRTGETHMFYHHQPVMLKPYLACTLMNPADAKCCLESDDSDVMILDQGIARISCEAGYQSQNLCTGIPLKYSVLKDGASLIQDEVISGDVAEVDFSAMEPGLYEFHLSMDAAFLDGRHVCGEVKSKILWLSPDSRHMDVPECIENVFQATSDDSIEFQVGAGAGPIWAVVELFGDSRQLLRSEVVYVQKGEMKTMNYEYMDEYPGGVVLNVMYFRKGECYRYSHIWRRPVVRREVPLEFTRFVDENLPGTRCTVSLRSLPGVEAVASVYDVATERIYSNPWRTVRRSAVAVRQVEIKSVKGVYGGSRSWEMGYSHPVFRNALMMNPYSSSDDLWELESSVVTLLSGSVAGVRGVSGVRKSRASTGIYGFRANMESIPFQMAESKAGFSGMEGISIRESFSAALAFEPFLYPDEDGTVTFCFDASDKLSTYVVSVFAHDREMNNDVVRREMTVTMPVKLSVVQPQYLYEGDVYVLNASVSSMSSADVTGAMMLEIYYGGTFEGQTPVARYMAEDLEIAAGGSASASFMIEVPSGVDTLGFKTVFAAGEFSDGMFVKVPVYPAGQVIREAHSAVLLSGESEEDIIRDLRERFVNGSSMGAEYSSLSVLDMLKASLPLVADASGKNAVSLSEAMYVNILSAGLRKMDGEDVGVCVEAARSAMEKLVTCVNEDGGFAWFEGMKSSPVVTALVLERFAGIRDRGLSEMMPSDCADIVSKAVKYLDSVYFNDSDRPVWYGGLSLQHYLAVRAMYAEVSFDEAAARKAIGAVEYRGFKTAAREFLVPSRGDAWTGGYVLGKVRMLNILSDLMSSKEGMKLARQWGVHGLNGSRMRRSMRRELISLKEYAVEHPSGGIYYPNAVMPWRGLLESEAYAHAMICNLFRELSVDSELGDGLAELADGISLWIMLQKETQAWKDDSGFIEAMASVYDASQAVKETRVVVLSKRFLKPFDQIKESGNGFRVSVAYYRDGKELQHGDTLSIGDKITARYSLWSEENRSFVRLSVPRAACMRPVDQLSGWTWGWFKPLAYGIFNVAPYSYREVKTDRTLYWFDVFPEENSTIEEELFVTQNGVYACPVAVVESLYAPHYRANDAWHNGCSVDLP